MEIKILVHGELIPESGAVSWWAEAPDLPGFSAAAATLVELRELAESSVRHIQGDEGLDSGDVTFRYQLKGQGHSRGPQIDQRAPEAQTSGPRVTAVA